MAVQQFQHSVESATLADLLERILDKGIVIAGDIRIKLVEIELLTIQLRLVVCSVDKAKELGLDWWNKQGELNGGVDRQLLSGLEQRLTTLESRIAEKEPRLPSLPKPAHKPRPRSHRGRAEVAQTPPRRNKR